MIPVCTHRRCRVGGGLPRGRTGFVFSVCRLISRRCHIIPSVAGCPSAPPRTVLALFTHTAPHSAIHTLSCMLCDAISWTPFTLRLCAAGVSSHRPALCRLLSSSGITRLLRYYETIRLPMPDKLLLSSYGCRSPLPFSGSEHRASRVAVFSWCHACHGLRPRGADGARPLKLRPYRLPTG
jgi:hypothetical protein